MDQQRLKAGEAIKGLSKWAALANWHIPKVQCFSRTSDFLHFFCCFGEWKSAAFVQSRRSAEAAVGPSISKKHVSRV
jgi:hypothetical protein